MLVFVFSAATIGWSLWNYYRPQVVLAACTDIAQRSSAVGGKRQIEKSLETEYDTILANCLSDSGIY